MGDCLVLNFSEVTTFTKVCCVHYEKLEFKVHCMCDSRLKQHNSRTKGAMFFFYKFSKRAANF